MVRDYILLSLRNTHKHSIYIHLSIIYYLRKGKPLNIFKIMFSKNDSERSLLRIGTQECVVIMKTSLKCLKGRQSTAT